MAISSRKEIRDHVLNTADLDTTNTSYKNLCNDYINITLHEIEQPAWAYSPRKEIHHFWSWLRRTKEFDTVASQADYLLGREIERIAKIKFDNYDPLEQISIDFYTEQIEDKTESGVPEYYLPWSVQGVSTKLSSAGTIDVVSSSSSDANDTDLVVTVFGWSSGIYVSETYTLNGTTKVTGSTTFDAREIFVSKAKDSEGNITVTTGSTTLLTLGTEERNPTFRVITMYKVPDAAYNGDIYFYTQIKEMVNDSDTPQFDVKWHYVVRHGTLAKMYKHMGKNEDYLASQAIFAAGVRAMVASDRQEPDHIEKVDRRNPSLIIAEIRRSSADVTP